MLLKLGTITAKFHQGPRALINLRLQISAGGKRERKNQREGRVRFGGSGGGGGGGGGRQVINNSRDCRRGQRALFCSARGAPYEPLHAAAAGTG